MGGLRRKGETALITSRRPARHTGLPAFRRHGLALAPVAGRLGFGLTGGGIGLGLGRPPSVPKITSLVMARGGRRLSVSGAPEVRRGGRTVGLRRPASA